MVARNPLVKELVLGRLLLRTLFVTLPPVRLFVISTNGARSIPLPRSSRSLDPTCVTMLLTATSFLIAVTQTLRPVQVCSDRLTTVQSVLVVRLALRFTKTNGKLFILLPSDLYSVPVILLQLRGPVKSVLVIVTRLKVLVHPPVVLPSSRPLTLLTIRAGNIVIRAIFRPPTSLRVLAGSPVLTRLCPPTVPCITASEIVLLIMVLGHNVWIRCATVVTPPRWALGQAALKSITKTVPPTPPRTFSLATQVRRSHKAPYKRWTGWTT